MTMRGFLLLLVAHLVYIHVPSSSAFSTSTEFMATHLPDIATTRPTTPGELCGADTCKNGGTCQNTTIGYNCLCSLGYNGDDCSTEYDPCSVNPCHNGGTCQYNRTEGVVDVRCICPVQFTGDHCDSEIVLPQCKVETCLNGGTCTDTGSDYTCTCPRGMSGDNCELECPPRKIDLLLIEDVSPSVTKTADYGAMKKFEIDLINDTRIDLSFIHVAEVVFAEEAKLGFKLNTFQTKASLVGALLNSTKEHGPTHLLKALKLADLNVFDVQQGDRTNVKNVVILFTDGRSRNAMALSEEAAALRKKALVYVVALTTEQDLDTIQKVASGSQYVFSDMKKALTDISDTLSEAICYG